MQSDKYGDLRAIWRRTGGKCHLCHRPVDLDTYGQVHIFGAETATVDHLICQSHGGGHDFDNLRIAHQGCNSRRKTRDADEARQEFSGRTREPYSTGQRVAITLLTTVGGALAGGVTGAIASKPTPDAAGQTRAKQGAGIGAFLGGVVGFVSGIAGTD